MKEFVEFQEIIELQDELIVPELRGANPHEYRLFSVVEHVGKRASSGHYVSYNLDSDDHWQLFDDHVVKYRELDSVLDA